MLDNAIDHRQQGQNPSNLIKGMHISVYANIFKESRATVSTVYMYMYNKYIIMRIW